MGDTFYAVQQLINGRACCGPTRCESLDEVRAFIGILTRYAKDNEADKLNVEYRVYEVKEIAY